MPLLRLTNGFDQLSDADLEVRAASILNGMTGNANFPTPSPSLAQVQTALDNFMEAVAVAKTGSQYQKADKNDKKQVLVGALHSLGYYVLFTANGNELVARSSNFRIAKTKGPSPAMTGFQNVELLDGANRGQLVLRFKRPQGAKSFIYGYAPEPLTETTVWTRQTGTRSKAVLTGLESGKRYVCEVTAIGVSGQQVTSGPVSRVVQ